MMLSRRVEYRDSLMQASIASVPELPKNDRTPPSIGATAARGVTIFDEPLDLVDRHGGLLFFRLPEAQHAEDPIEDGERPLDRLRIVDADPAEIDGGVHGVNELENRAERAGRVQIVHHR